MEVIFFLFPIAIFLFLLYLNLKCLSAILLFVKLKKDNNLVDGFVIGLEPRSFGYAAPIINFNDKNGNKIEGIAQNAKTIRTNSFGSNYWKIGSNVEVLYSEADPTFFVTNSILQQILISVIFIITGSILVSIVINVLIDFIK